MGIEFKSPGAEMAKSLRQMLVDREMQRRQEMLDGILLEGKMREQARQDMEAARQAELDRIAAEGRQRRIAEEDRAIDLAPYSVGDDLPEAIAAKYPEFATPGRKFRGTPAQRDAAAKEATRVAEREDTLRRQSMRDSDAAANRYLDSELDRAEREAQRKSNERVANINASGRNTKADTPTDDRAAAVIDALDELSERINQAEGLAARATGSWKSAAATVNYDDDTAEYTAVLEGAVPLIARRMGHTGVLTERDVESVKAMFPKPGDSKSLRDRKIARIRTLMGGSGSGSTKPRSSYRVTVE